MPTVDARSRGLWVMFVSTHQKGHINPLSAVAEELASRSTVERPVRVSFATFDVREVHAPRHYAAADYSQAARDRVPPSAEFVSAGMLPHSVEEDERMMGELFDMDDMWQQLQGWKKLMGVYERVMGPSLVKYFSDHGHPDYLVVDAIANGGVNAADAAGLPMAVVQTTGLPVTGARESFQLPFGAWQPPLMSTNTVEEMGILQRYQAVAMQIIYEAIQRFILLPARTKARAAIGAAPMNVSFGRNGKPCPLIIAAAFGLDYAVSLPPYVFPVGLMSNPSIASIPEMPNELQTWLDSSTTPVIFVSTGTDDVDQLSAFTAPDFTYRVLWSLKEASQTFLPKQLPKTILVSTYFPQARVLAHKNIRAFLSHCGANSVLEAIVTEVPVLALPFCWDQPMYAARLRAAGMAEVLDKDNIAARTLYQAASKVIEDPSYMAAAARLHAAVRLAGGKERAADVILYLARFGHEDLIPFGQTLPWYQAHHLDLIAPLGLLGAGLLFLIKSIVSLLMSTF